MRFVLTPKLLGSPRTTPPRRLPLMQPSPKVSPIQHEVRYKSPTELHAAAFGLCAWVGVFRCAGYLTKAKEFMNFLTQIRSTLNPRSLSEQENNARVGGVSYPMGPLIEVEYLKPHKYLVYSVSTASTNGCPSSPQTEELPHKSSFSKLFTACMVRNPAAVGTYLSSIHSCFSSRTILVIKST
jgi:hypothetical protein